MKLMYFSRSASEWALSSHHDYFVGSVSETVEHYRRLVNHSGCYCVVTDDTPSCRVHVPSSTFPDFDIIRGYEGGVFAGALDDLMTLQDYLAREPPNHPSPTSAPILTDNSEPGEPLVSIDIKRGKVDGADHGSALMLIVNARPLHDLLDTLGCEVVGDTYRNPPNSGSRVLDNSDNLSTTVLLKRAYPYKINLSEVFSNPPTIARLRHLAESANAAVRRILEHYRPIDIRVTIQKQPVA